MREGEVWFLVCVYREYGKDPERHKGVEFGFDVRDSGALLVGRQDEYGGLDAYVAYAPGFWSKATVEEIEG